VKLGDASGRFGYDFLYWFKRAFGARVRCGRRFAPSSRTRHRSPASTTQSATHWSRTPGSTHFEPPTRPTTMCPPVSDLKGAPRRWRDGLRPPLTPDTGEQAGGYRVDGSPLANLMRAPPAHPGPLDDLIIRTGLTLRVTPP
jgi:hypothetical protein